MAKAPLLGRGPVQGSCLRSMEGHWGALLRQHQGGRLALNFTLQVRWVGVAARHEAPSCEIGRVDITPREPS